MSCIRCHGLLIVEPLSMRPSWWWKCLNCGNREDRAILRNRAEQASIHAEMEHARHRQERGWAVWIARLPA